MDALAELRKRIDALGHVMEEEVAAVTTVTVSRGMKAPSITGYTPASPLVRFNPHRTVHLYYYYIEPHLYFTTILANNFFTLSFIVPHNVGTSDSQPRPVQLQAKWS